MMVLLLAEATQYAIGSLIGGAVIGGITLSAKLLPWRKNNNKPSKEVATVITEREYAEDKFVRKDVCDERTKAIHAVVVCIQTDVKELLRQRSNE